MEFPKDFIRFAEKFLKKNMEKTFTDIFKLIEKVRNAEGTKIPNVFSVEIFQEYVWSFVL